ncbi:MAG: ribonuclease III [Bacteroidetes bacterium HGW-Bacteroidetes-6]|jgi:ribonuclease-3|nr:MAG: ribonuclease III [Bacteroidetes bacterium HGW-Bacteroidetes-6]
MLGFIFNKSHVDDLSKNIKNIFGFRPGNIFLYELAFLHKAAKAEKNGHEMSNERLEYLGDAVIDLIVADYLFKKFPFADEGDLTEMRSRIVSRNSLSRMAEKLGIGQLLVKHKNGSIGVSSSDSGNAFEAFFGAVFLDKGYRFAQNLLVNFIFGRRIDIEAVIHTETNFKSRLIEHCQRERLNLEFIVVDKVGYGRKRQYIIEATIDGVAQSKGIDFSVKGAEQQAAEKALDALAQSE